MNRQTKLIVLFFCILKLTLHLIADSHSRFQGDELLHIEAGKHLAFGYMEFPPLIGLIAFVQKLFHSNSIFIYHLFSHIAAILIIIYAAKITIELGGKTQAVFLVLLAIIIAPGFGRSQQLFQPVVFSQLFWVLGFYQLVKFGKYLDKKSLWYLTLFCILGFLTKYDSIFFIFGLSALLFFKRTRSALIEHKFWINCIVFLLCIAPNVVWQYANEFPLLQMTHRLYETQLDKISRLDNMTDLLIAVNPIVSLVLLIPAIIFLFKSKGIALARLLSIVIGLSFLLLLYKNGKPYYFFPIVLTLLPFGALFWEEILLKKKWILYPILGLMILGAVLIPFGMPIYSFNRYLDKVYLYDKKYITRGEYAVSFDEYYTEKKWKTTMESLKSVYDHLPNNEKQDCLIWENTMHRQERWTCSGKRTIFPKHFPITEVFIVGLLKEKCPIWLSL